MSTDECSTSSRWGERPHSCRPPPTRLAGVRHSSWVLGFTASPISRRSSRLGAMRSSEGVGLRDLLCSLLRLGTLGCIEPPQHVGMEVLHELVEAGLQLLI